MKDSIYIKTLELGFENNKGISFNETVEKLNIDLSDIRFEVNYTIWFYSNFYNHNVEDLIIGQKKAINSDYRINQRNIEDKIRPYNDNISFIRGDALNKYIDYLELKSSRKSSKVAIWFSSASLIFAMIPIIAPIISQHYVKPMHEVIITNEKNQITESETNDSIEFKLAKEKMIDTKRDSTCKLNQK